MAGCYVTATPALKDTNADESSFPRNARVVTALGDCEPCSPCISYCQSEEGQAPGASILIVVGPERALSVLTSAARMEQH